MKAKSVPSHPSIPPIELAGAQWGPTLHASRDATVDSLRRVNWRFENISTMCRLTNHIAGSAFCSKKLCVGHCIRQSHQQTGTTFEPCHWVVFRDLQAPFQRLHGDLSQSTFVDFVRFCWIAAKCASLEHLQASNGKSFASSEHFGRFFGSIRPSISCPCIKQDRDSEEINQPASPLLSVDSARPRLKQLIDSWTPSSVEVLPPPMRWNRLIVALEVSLEGVE